MRPHGGQDCTLDGSCRVSAELTDEVLDAGITELLSGWIDGFCNAIGIDHQHIPFFQGHRIFLEREFLHDTQDYTPDVQAPDRAVVLDKNRLVMPGVAVGESVRRTLQQTVHKRHELFG